MNKTSTSSDLNQSQILVDLNRQHAIFHKYLDKLVLSYSDLNTIDLLIEVRQLNLDCLNRYTGLISNKIEFRPSEGNSTLGQTTSRLRTEDMTLWNIHGQLARLIPVYTQALLNKNLNKVVRMIVSHNYDQLIRMKEHLLHPVEEMELA